MSNYTGSTCPVCHKPFTPTDDVVVCPDCGTPYHRVCWPRDGVCVNAARHGTGFEWKPDGEADDGQPACPNCGAHNPAGAHFCNHCGVPLPDHPQNAGQQPGAQGGANAAQRPIYENPNYEGPNPRRDNAAPHIDAYTAGPDGLYRREVGPDDPIDGIKARDWATFVGPSSLYYLMQFFRMEQTHHKVSLSFSAFLFGPIYFFYRKMWKLGALFAALDLLVTVPTYLSLLVLSHAPIVSGMSTEWLIPAMNVCAVVSWVVMLVRALFAGYWYKKACTDRIHAIYDRIPEGQDRQDMLALRGGVSVPAVVIYLLACLALTWVMVALGVTPAAAISMFGM